MLSVLSLYLLMHQIPCALGCKAHLSVWHEKGAFYAEHLTVVLLCIVHQCDECLSSWRRGGSRLGCRVLAAISAVSILELAPNTGGSRMSQAPNLHLVTELLMLH